LSRSCTRDNVFGTKGGDLLSRARHDPGPNAQPRGPRSERPQAYLLSRFVIRTGTMFYFLFFLSSLFCFISCSVFLFLLCFLLYFFFCILMSILVFHFKQVALTYYTLLKSIEDITISFQTSFKQIVLRN